MVLEPLGRAEIIPWAGQGLGRGWQHSRAELGALQGAEFPTPLEHCRDGIWCPEPAHGWILCTVPWTAHFTLRFHVPAFLVGVEKLFSLLFVCSGNVMNLIYNFQRKFSCECFCSLETCYYFIPIGEMLTLLFETSQNTAILTFGKHHYVKILHCMVKKINLSIFLKPQSLNFIT